MTGRTAVSAGSPRELASRVFLICWLLLTVCLARPGHLACAAQPSRPPDRPASRHTDQMTASATQGCTETFVYRPDGAPLGLLYTPAGTSITQRYWYALDGKGNVVALTDASGKVVDRYHYDLWGVPTIDREDVPQPFLYGGYVYDREFSGPGESTGWYWLD